jgi:hypothetical protein
MMGPAFPSATQPMNHTKKFQRTVENFRCGNCGRAVTGDGYTNHCPDCLHSLHVDVNPGDRAEDCQGLMAPVDYEVKGTEYVIVHRCTVCGFLRRTRMRREDNMDALLGLARARADGSAKTGGIRRSGPSRRRLIY